MNRMVNTIPCSHTTRRLQAALTRLQSKPEISPTLGDDESITTTVNIDRKPRSGLGASDAELRKDRADTRA